MTMDFITKNIWFILFVIWGLPLGYYRSKFRKIVYQTDSWLINIKPLFLKEIKGLFGNIYPENSHLPVPSIQNITGKGPRQAIRKSVFSCAFTCMC